MWAFAIYNKETKDIFISRDRYGIKPLYYFLDKDRFIFASTIPAILKILEIKPAPDNQIIYDYLVYDRTDHRVDTFVKEIKKLDPGHLIKTQNNFIKIKEWYNLRKRITKPFENTDEFRNTLISSVGLRLQSDVPLGVCLSGGLDSSGIVSILLRNFNETNLQTFSAVYGLGKSGDESKYIYEYKNLLKNMHFIHPTAETLFNDLSDFIKAHGEPTLSSAAYAQFKVMELAKEHVVVTLDGQGSDEQLAGYHYSFGYYFKGLFRKLSILKLLSEIYHYMNIHKSTYAVKYFLYYFFPSLFNTGETIRKYLSDEFENTYSTSSLRNENLYHSVNLNESLINNFKYKLPYILKWQDSNSSWFSLESRVPFIDYRIVERSLSLPSKYLIYKGTTKKILRDSMQGIIPEIIRERQDKVGFHTPQDEWFRQPVFKKYIFDLLDSNEFSTLNIINKNKAKNLYQAHVDLKKNIADEIWKWINLDLWFKEYIY
jgi:asparagine synthase (glutamine-hydrolysing)